MQTSSNLFEEMVWIVVIFETTYGFLLLHSISSP